jgi:hypothetical protein
MPAASASRYGGASSVTDAGAAPAHERTSAMTSAPRASSPTPPSQTEKEVRWPGPGGCSRAETERPASTCPSHAGRRLRQPQRREVGPSDARGGIPRRRDRGAARDGGARASGQARGDALAAATAGIPVGLRAAGEGTRGGGGGCGGGEGDEGVGLVLAGDVGDGAEGREHAADIVVCDIGGEAV